MYIIYSSGVHEDEWSCEYIIYSSGVHEDEWSCEFVCISADSSCTQCPLFMIDMYNMYVWCSPLPSTSM